MKKWNEPNITELNAKLTKEGGPGNTGDFVENDVLENGNVSGRMTGPLPTDPSDIS